MKIRLRALCIVALLLLMAPFIRVWLFRFIIVI